MNEYNLRPVPLTNNPESAYKNKVAKAVNGNNIIGGNGIDISYYPEGTVISIGDTLFPDLVKWAGDFDITAEYFPGEIVRVRPDRVYFDYNNLEIPIGSTAVAGYDAIPISIGLFICEQYVPPSFSDETYLEDHITHQFGNLPDRYLKGTRFYTKNVYYPIYPEIPCEFTSSVSVANGAGNIIANNCFWTAWPFGALVSKECSSGRESRAYTLMVDSGSIFNPDYLPYTE